MTAALQHFFALLSRDRKESGESFNPRALSANPRTGS